MATAELESGMSLTFLTRDERLSIKDALTIPNPAYAAAVKYSRSGYVTRVPENLFYYEDRNGTLSVPIGFDAGKYCGIADVSDHRKSIEVNYPEFKITLREDQQKAASAYIDKNGREHVPQGLIQLPTGKGKSLLGIYLAYTLRQKTLVLVHKTDLVLAWREDIQKCFAGEVKSGLIKTKDKIIGEQITIATVQTLSKWPKEDLEKLYQTFGMVIVDECHHIGCNTFNLAGKFNALYKLGLSATPERADGLTKVMNFYLGYFAYKYTYQADEKDILPVKVILRENSFKYVPCVVKGKGHIENLFEMKGTIQVKRRDNNLIPVDSMPYSHRPDIRYHMIDNAVLNSDLFSDMVITDIVTQFYCGHNCVAFFSQKEMCRIYHERIAAEIGAKNVQLFYGDSAEDDETILSRAESGEVRVTLTTYSKGTEGTNCKAWDTAFLVSSLNNEKNVEQAIGRIRRVKEGKPDKARVFDYRHPYVYGWSRHGSTRDKRYTELKFETPETQRDRFSRGYHNEG